MTELDLYRFIEENDIEWRYEDNSWYKDVLIFLYTFQLEGFAKLVKGIRFDEGINIVLNGNYVAIWMKDICEYVGIEIEKVFKT